MHAESEESPLSNALVIVSSKVEGTRSGEASGLSNKASEQPPPCWESSNAIRRPPTDAQRQRASRATRRPVRSPPREVTADEVLSRKADLTGGDLTVVGSEPLDVSTRVVRVASRCSSRQRGALQPISKLQRAKTPVAITEELRNVSPPRWDTPGGASVVAPVHELRDCGINVDVASWPAPSPIPRAMSRQQSRGSTSRPPLPAPVGLHDPTFLQEITQFVRSELRLVSANDHASKMRLYRDVLTRFIDKFSCYSEILSQVREVFDVTVTQYEQLTQDYLRGDKTVQLEKERYLSLQSQASERIEEGKRAADDCRRRELQAQQDLIVAQRKFEDDLSKLRAENDQLRKQAAMEKCVRREGEDNLNTYARLHHESKMKLEEAREEIATFKSGVAQRIESLEEMAKTAKEEVELLKSKLEHERHSFEEKFAKLKSTSIDQAEYLKMKEKTHNLAEVIRVLERKTEWTANELKSKESYEPPINWSEIGEDYAQLKRAGRSSEAIVRLLVHRVARAQRHEALLLRQVGPFLAMRDYLNSFDFCYVMNKKRKAATPGSPRGATSVGSPLASTGTQRVRFGDVLCCEGDVSSQPRAIPMLSCKELSWIPPVWEGSGDCQDARMEHQQVKDIFVSAFVLCGSTGTALPAALERVCRALYDFTTCSTFFANLVRSMQSMRDCDPFLHWCVRMLEGALAPAADYARPFLNSLRLLYICFERTEKALTSRIGGVLPRRVIAECVAQSLPHKTAGAMIRIKHALFVAAPSAPTKNVCYREVFGSFHSARPSRLLVELVDQYCEEAQSFATLLFSAVFAASKEDQSAVPPAGAVCYITPPAVVQCISHCLEEQHQKAIAELKEDGPSQAALRLLSSLVAEEVPEHVAVRWAYEGFTGKSAPAAWAAPSLPRIPFVEDDGSQSPSAKAFLLTPQASIDLVGAVTPAHLPDFMKTNSILGEVSRKAGSGSRESPEALRIISDAVSNPRQPKKEEVLDLLLQAWREKQGTLPPVVAPTAPLQAKLSSVKLAKESSSAATTVATETSVDALVIGVEELVSNLLRVSVLLPMPNMIELADAERRDELASLYTEVAAAPEKARLVRGAKAKQ